MAKEVSVTLTLILLAVVGCASPDERRQTMAWQEICRHAPHRAGQPIDYAEQRAMDVVDGWKDSVERIDEVCATR